MTIFRWPFDLFRWGVLTLALLLFSSPALAGRANVFVYHRFGDARYPTTNISIETFASQLEWLHSQGYHVLPLGEVVRRLRLGDNLPERCAVLTIDDAYRSFLTGGMPLLRKYGFPATLFVSTNPVGHGGYLTWEEIKALQDEGVEIGNHSSSHAYLLDRRKGESEKVWQRRVSEDIVRAQRVLAEKLGSTATLFAYPFGEYSPKLIEIVRKLGFEGAAAQQSGVVGDESDPYILPRFPMGGRYATVEGFREKLAMKRLPVRVISPSGPVVGHEDPPTLVVEIDGKGIDLGRLRCFVQGQDNGEVIADSERPGRYIVHAREILAGRRNKYTLTAPGASDGAWYWFSQLWVKPQGP